MAATVQVSEWNGTQGAEAESANVSHAHWLSIDSPGTSDKSVANPIAVPGAGTQYSFPKYHKLKLTALGGALRLKNFRPWLSAAPPANVKVFTSSENPPPGAPTYATPSDSSKDGNLGTTEIPEADPGDSQIGTPKDSPEANIMDEADDYTDYHVSQAELSPGAVGFSANLVFGWDEVS